MPLEEAFRFLETEDAERVPVVDDQHRLVGVLSRSVLQRRLAEDEEASRFRPPHRRRSPPCEDPCMIVCPRCGEENPERARFCLACGSRSSREAPAGEERKVVSVLFVDLVGFTDRSDRADPEDVRATLRPYHERVKADIERFGGTVEKFIGDAVMAVFGAPVAHEDDAERAVRAALRILETIEELRDGRPRRRRPRGRRRPVRPSSPSARGRSEARASSRATSSTPPPACQSAAPVGAVIVDEPTMRSTEARRSTFEPLEPVAAKGKAEPIPVWRATACTEPRRVSPSAATATLRSSAASTSVQSCSRPSCAPSASRRCSSSRSSVSPASVRAGS